MTSLLTISVCAAAAAAALAAVRVTAAKRAAVDRLATVLAASPLAIVELDADGIVLGWSGAAERLFGWSAAEVAGRRFPVAASGADAGHLLHLVLGERLLAGEELACSRRGAPPLAVALYTSPLGSSPNGRLLLAADASERAELAERLAHAERMEALGRLAAGIAHDFSNLVLVIRGHAWLIRNNVGAAAESEVAAIERASDDARRILHQLLAFGRKTARRPEVFDLREVLDSVGTMVEPLLGAGLELARTYDTRPATVRADRTQLELVLLNLALNARDAQPDGGMITFQSAIVERDGERWVEARVTDAGHGMDEATRAQVFEPYFTTKADRGTGLGLSIVRDLAVENGGDVEVTSEPGEGTTFRLYFPCARPDVAVPDPEDARGLDDGLETVLLVENEHELSDALGVALERYGYKVLTAESPAAALARSGEGGIDVVVSDVRTLTRVGEFEARLAAVSPGLPIVFVTDQAEGLPANRPPELCLVRPFTPTLLAGAIRAALRSARGDTAEARVPETPLRMAHAPR